MCCGCAPSCVQRRLTRVPSQSCRALNSIARLADTEKHLAAVSPCHTTGSAIPARSCPLKQQYNTDLLSRHADGSLSTNQFRIQIATRAEGRRFAVPLRLVASMFLDDRWWAAALTPLRPLPRNIEPSEISSIGLYHMHPLHPTWSDLAKPLLLHAHERRMSNSVAHP